MPGQENNGPSGGTTTTTPLPGEQGLQIILNSADNTAATAYDRVFGNRTSVENVTSRGTSIENMPNSDASTAANDFASLRPVNIKTVSTGRGDVIVGELSDGSIVVLRPSKDGRTTIEFQNSNRRTTKEIRYGSK